MNAEKIRVRLCINFSKQNSVSCPMDLLHQINLLLKFEKNSHNNLESRELFFVKENCTPKKFTFSNEINKILSTLHRGNITNVRKCSKIEKEI